MKTGDWVWDQRAQKPIQIISVETIWGKETIKAYYPTDNQVKTIEPINITQIKENPINSKQQLIHLLTAAKISNFLYSNESLSPVQSDIIPLPHQLYALDKTLESPKIRYLFADEVGLGKTIEAGLVLTELKNKGLADRILIVAPRGLTKQWVDELHTRFNETFQLVIPSNITELQETNIWLQSDKIVTSLDSVKPLRRRSGWSQEKIDQYNEKRFKDLVEADWDLIIVDEAHKISGASTGVARHRLGQSLSEAAPFLLLLSATPHQGKTEQFKRLVSLLDDEKFGSLEIITKEQIQPYVVRTEKRTAINNEGNTLFTPRTTRLIPVIWEPKHNDQRKLYNELTDYIRYGYNKAEEENRAYIGFLMVLMQRLVSSSTRAIRQALEKRLQVLETGEAIYSEEQDLNLFSDLEGQIKIDELFLKIGDSFRDEKKEVENLASLARRCENNGPDARAEALLTLIYQQRSEENNPDLKFLIFTEFLPTQDMLNEFLENRGFKTVILNGSMDLNTRLEAQNKFAEEAQILISTEAGGEGINLQFCHIIINYDLPWNPMRLEQRIGRVDRIGQKHPVKAYNLVFENTIEYRIREVLEEKLQIILKEFGVDKLSDVIDADDAEIDFANIYRDALIAPDKATRELEKYLENLKNTLSQIKETQLLSDDKKLTLQRSQDVMNHSLPELTRKLALNYIEMKNGKTEKKDELYNLAFPDGTLLEKIRFTQQITMKGKLVTIKHPTIKKILENTPIYVQGMSIPEIKISNIPAELSGYFSLWETKIHSNLAESKTVFPIFINDEKRFLKPSSNQLWDILLQDETKITFAENNETDPYAIFDTIKEYALMEGEQKLEQLKQQYREKTFRIKNKEKTQLDLRLQATTRIRQVKERTLKREAYEKEYQEWLNKYELEDKPYYDLQPLMLLRVESLEN